jgi:hypothetical protein
MVRHEENGHLSARDVLQDRFLPQKSRIKATHAAEGWLCTHAGVAPGIADIIPGKTITDGTPAIAAWLNEEFEREFQEQVYMLGEGLRRHGTGPLFQIHRCRAGTDPFGGIFWFDPISEMIDPSPQVGRQIFGHTPVPYPEIGAHWVNLNNIKKGIWIFDTVENCLLELCRGEKIQYPSPK